MEEMEEERASLSCARESKCSLNPPNKRKGRQQSFGKLRGEV